MPLQWPATQTPEFAQQGTTSTIYALRMKTFSVAGLAALFEPDRHAKTAAAQQVRPRLSRPTSKEELFMGTERRAEALERMRAAGVTVIDVSPSGMTAAVVNRYLEIKARGAL